MAIYIQKGDRLASRSGRFAHFVKEVHAGGVVVLLCGRRTESKQLAKPSKWHLDCRTCEKRLRDGVA